MVRGFAVLPGTHSPDILTTSACMPWPYIVNEMHFFFPIFSINPIGGKAIYSVCKQLPSFLKASSNWASSCCVAQLDPNLLGSATVPGPDIPPGRETHGNRGA